VEDRLKACGMTVATLQTTPSFVRLQVNDGRSAVVVDLISEPMEGVEPAVAHIVGRAEILVDSPRAILAEKLCALLERSELRDLIDVEALVRSGQNLDLAISEAPRRDAGFSPLTLAWLLRDFDLKGMAKATGMVDPNIAHLDDFRQALIDRLLDPLR